MAGSVTLLGTGTCQFLLDRMASSVLIQVGGLRVVYDFGRGTALQLVKLGIRSNEVRHIILSHLHPDHSSDLIPYLHAACWSRIDPRSAALHLYGPPGLRPLVEAMLGLYGPNALHKPDAFSITVREISSGTLEIEGWPFEFVHLPPRQNHGVAFTYQGQRYAFAGDSHFHEEEVAFVSGAELAVIDAGHQSGEEIVELASRAQPRMLVLSHLYDEPAADSLTARAQERGFEGKIIVGQDLMSFSLD